MPSGEQRWIRVRAAIDVVIRTWVCLSDLSAWAFAKLARAAISAAKRVRNYVHDTIAERTIEASEAVSRKHFQPEFRWSIGLLLVAAMLSLLVYSLIMEALYNRLEDGIKSANVINSVLDDLELQATSPLRGASRDADLRFRDGQPITRQIAYDYLRSIGVIDGTTVTLNHVTDKPSPDDPIPRVVARDLVEHITVCGGGKLRDLLTVDLVVCMVMRRGFAEVPDCSREEKKNTCAVAELLRRGTVQALAGTPQTSDSLAAAVVDSGGNCAALKPVAPECDALRLRVMKAPSLRSYLVMLPDPPPTTNDVTRTLLFATGILPVSEPRPDNSEIAKGVAKDAALEKTIRASLARVMTDGAVKSTQSLLGGLRGWEQAAMLWVFVALLLLLFARALARIKLAEEVKLVSHWLKHWVRIIRSQPSTKSAQGSANEHMTSFRGLLDQIEAHINTPPVAILHESAIVRSDSLALFMAGKAVRRMLVANPEPELFRSYCDDQRQLVENSAWFLRYLSRALPALGFIGTVHGIMAALTDADSIVRATSPDQMATSMALLTSPLSLAFATTFVALAFGLVTSYATDLEIAKERILLATLESELIECVDPAEDQLDTGSS